MSSLFDETTYGPSTTLIDYGEPTPLGQAELSFAVVFEGETREWLAYFKYECDAKAFALIRQEAEGETGPLTGAPKVKPLVWERADLLCWGETAQNAMGGSYRMTWEFGEGPNSEDTFFTVRFNGVGLYSGWAFDADLAMAAAQADHERRIWDWLE